MPKVKKLPKVPSSAPKLKPRKPMQPLKPMKPLKAKMTDEEMAATLKKMNKENEIRKKFSDPAIRSQKLEELKMSRLKKTASQIANAVLVKMAAEDEGVGAGERALRVGGGLVGGTLGGAAAGGLGGAGIGALLSKMENAEGKKYLADIGYQDATRQELRELRNQARNELHHLRKRMRVGPGGRAHVRTPQSKELVKILKGMNNRQLQGYRGAVLAALGLLGGAGLGALGGTTWGALSGGD